jgi:hypothetical protein
MEPTMISIRSPRNICTALVAIPLALAVACGSSDAEPDPATVATQALIQDVATAATDLNSALEDPDISSQAWRANAVAALAALSTQVARTTAELENVEGATPQQQQLALATTKYSEAAGVLALGIETLDLQTIDAAAILLGQAAASLAAAQLTLNQN